ncbi:hypothetical protein ACOMHN_067291 [Nucella lapillus]
MIITMTIIITILTTITTTTTTIIITIIFTIIITILTTTTTIIVIIITITTTVILLILILTTIIVIITIIIITILTTTTNTTIIITTTTTIIVIIITINTTVILLILILTTIIIITIIIITILTTTTTTTTTHIVVVISITTTVVWRRASDPNPLTIGEDTFVGDTRFFVRHRLHALDWNLHIRHATPQDGGVYECHVITKSRNVRQFVLLHVQEMQFSPTHKPAIDISGQHYVDDGSHFVEMGNTLTLTCRATGLDYPPDDLDWFKDGLKLTNSRRLHLSKDVSLSDKTIVSTLQVSRAVMRDAGTYVCRASDLQVTSAKVNVLNTHSVNSKRDSSNASTTGPHAHSSSPRPSPLSLLPLIASLALHFIAS